MVISDRCEVEKAYAKLNLYLDVLSKREDGFHNIVGIFQTIDLCDLLEFQLIDNPFGIEIESNVPIEGQNLIEKAFEIICRHYEVDFGLKVKLTKKIPIGSGLGGGSSDAAATLRFLSRKLKIPKDEILLMAQKVGSDVPFLIDGGTALVEGRGERITHLEPITAYSVNLFCSKTAISTKSAYSMLTADDFDRGPKPIERLYDAYKNHDIESIRSFSYNVFQKTICSLYPEISTNLKSAWAENPIVAMMTGTGSCIFSVHNRGGEYTFNAGSWKVQ